MVCIDDPPREEIIESVKISRQAGIKIKIITGDNKETAVQVAKEIGIKGNLLTGAQMDKMTDDELQKVVSKIVIFARVRPEHKLRIVKALKKLGEIVTMTGDGVNDAPALKEAHIGVAMGKNGTDVSREAADLVLKDDNFKTILSAVKAGRTIFNNIQKFITYQLSINYSELFIIFFAILLNLPLPLLALQILFMNMVTDNIPALSLGFNPSSVDAMQRKPRKKGDILNRRLVKTLALAGTVIGSICISVFYITLKITGDLGVARTNTLIALIFLEIMHAYNFRSFRQLVLRTTVFRNRYLVYASLVSLGATIMVMYTGLSRVFEVTPLSFENWVVLFVASLIIIFVMDAWKVYHNRRNIAIEQN
jgi:P-type Ca2+ transporter type 2C